MELVVALHREELTKQGAGEHGLYPIKLDQIDPIAFALLPRHIAGNKSPSSVSLGGIFPQVIVYITFKDINGRVFTYNRKSKDPLLLGRYSVGVGGHADYQDLEVIPTIDITNILLESAVREVKEELGLDISSHVFSEDFKLDHVLISDDSLTSQIHVGFPVSIELSPHEVNSIKLDTNEFNNVQWLSVEELVEMDNDQKLDIEEWSRIMIRDFNK